MGNIATNGAAIWEFMVGTPHLYALVTSQGVAVFHQQMVELDGTSYATPQGQVTGVIQESEGSAGDIVGSVVSIFTHQFDPVMYLPVTTVGNGVIAGYVMVADHPYQRFLIDEDGDTTPIAVANVGYNCDCTAEVGNVNTGLSTMQLDSTDVNTTNTLMFRLLNFHPHDTPVTANCRWIVSMNTHFMSHDTTGA